MVVQHRQYKNSASKDIKTAHLAVQAFSTDEWRNVWKSSTFFRQHFPLKKRENSKNRLETQIEDHYFLQHPQKNSKFWKSENFEKKIRIIFKISRNKSENIFTTKKYQHFFSMSKIFVIEISRTFYFEHSFVSKTHFCDIGRLKIW